jgi:cathepsin L
MKLSLYILAALVAVSCATDVLHMQEWTNFKLTHNKKYASTQEELHRFNIFLSNSAFVKRHNVEANQGLHTYTVEMNKFGDLTSDEFAAIYNGYNSSLRVQRTRNMHIVDESVAIPDSVDWRTQGYVTDIKDQGQCGSCWAFSSTGSLEGQHFKASGTLVSLSEQNLVDCSGKYGNQGCNGGLMDQAFTYIKENKGIDTETSYPYTARDGTCNFDASNIGATDSGFSDIKAHDESALANAIATVGPISVAIDASHASFQFYKSGIYYDALCSSSRLDHGVLAVGYGTDSGKDYYIVKNSWGTSWGDKGYIKMSRNKKNNCGIATAASYPLV